MCWALASLTLASCAMGVMTDDEALDAAPADDVAETRDATAPDAPSSLDAPVADTGRPTPDASVATDVPPAVDVPAATDVPSAIDVPSATDIPPAVDVRPAVDVPSCPSGSSLCAGGCVVTRTDPAHCGGCGRACTVGQTCDDGACVVTCGGATTRCGAACFDLSRDVTNCGACGRACAAGQACGAGVCTSPLIEGFETGAWPWSPWQSATGNVEWTASAACAHDGARGLAGPNGGSRWYYRTDRTLGAPGERLSAWFRPTTAMGRAYLGFGASAAGAWSLVFASNTRQLAIYRHASWGFSQLATTAATFSAGAWYRAEVTFGAAGMVTGRVYDATGATVATVATTAAGLTTGGVALYAFNVCVDTIEVR